MNAGQSAEVAWDAHFARLALGDVARREAPSERAQIRANEGAARTVPRVS
jgi:hypothetical protein